MGRKVTNDLKSKIITEEACRSRRLMEDQITQRTPHQREYHRLPVCKQTISAAILILQTIHMGTNFLSWEATL